MNFLQAVQWVLNLGAAVMLPIIITIVGVAFGMRVSSALRSGMFIGIGFTGLNLTLGILTGTMGPIAKAMAVASGIKLDVIDMGWEMTSAAAWATPYAALVIPLGVGLNLLMLKMRWTKTLNVDIWNYWHFLFASSLAFVITGNFLWGLLIALICSAVTLKVADWLMPIWQNYWDLHGTTCTTMGNTVSLGVQSWFFAKIIDAIPGINKIEITPQGVQEKLGVIGEPMFLGAIIGGGIAIIGKQPAATVVKTAATVSAFLVLMPRMVQLLMEGLRPISIAAQELMKKRLKGQEVQIGMDVALGLGDPTVIATVLIMIPIKLLLAFILPGNRYFPLASLASPYTPVFPAAFARGNIFRAVLITTLITVFTMYLGTYFAPIATDAVKWAGIKLPDGTLVAGASGLHQVFVIGISKVFAPLFGK